jgi:hypothetical protein
MIQVILNLRSNFKNFGTKDEPSLKPILFTGIHSSPTVIELLNFYQDPMCCMFFEPLLVRGVAKTNTFSLQVRDLNL